ncbi:hypothetical protein [Shinella zoogloeoides]|uniref:hypothetical protein n=1 Tax=Shinella zoogloeoides TaxID=352475 RepID=UPI0013C2AE02|nr:hypothetical protein [Shinella zoogloeoides]
MRLQRLCYPLRPERAFQLLQLAGCPFDHSLEFRGGRVAILPETSAYPGLQFERLPLPVEELPKHCSARDFALAPNIGHLLTAAELLWVVDIRGVHAQLHLDLNADDTVTIREAALRILPSNRK